jgi:hypothetical protein
MKFKLKGHWLDTNGVIQAESQRVLDTDWKGLPVSGTGVYMREGTTSRSMAAEMPYGEFYDVYSVSPEYFWFRHVYSYTFLCFSSK